MSFIFYRIFWSFDLCVPIMIQVTAEGHKPLLSGPSAWMEQNKSLHWISAFMPYLFLYSLRYRIYSNHLRLVPLSLLKYSRRNKVIWLDNHTFIIRLYLWHYRLCPLDNFIFFLRFEFYFYQFEFSF
jgi:hypothetical protein